ncbi:MAG TPA: alanine--tRNA ligase [Candidatus Aquilonibacter sp.]|nr:alanine--tRNA ligase [Candidatus Aquilonibacter sp.]
MMTSAQIRQSFLDFFKSKQHTIVPSSSLMPDSPNLLFTNAGMNQFVPIFLGQTKCPYTPGRAADTQKCIRAGGKHNDLDDVGLDTYHHTFFEMLGNWSFGDYFKKEAIAWAWELVVEKWKFPPARLYATIYSPDKSKNDPSEFDQEAWDCWAEKFRGAGLDPKIHIVHGGKKDNFWMMGETGPCGPCSELHVDLTPDGKTEGKLVNKGDARCIEIWNLVFIQFNANPDGTFSPLPARHVDTGMGFERVTSIIQGTKGLTDFAHARISNYETDIFRPIFDKLEQLSGKIYRSTLPGMPGNGQKEPIYPSANVSDAVTDISGVTTDISGAVTDVSGAKTDVSGTTAKAGGQAAEASQETIAADIAFRVIADHIRTLSFAIADGIQPGNNDRNYVLRRILRRAVRYGRTLGFKEPFFYKLVDVLADTMGDVFPEIRARKKQVQETIRTEEEAFNKTLDKGLEMLEAAFIQANEERQRINEITEAGEISLTGENYYPDAEGKYVKTVSSFGTKVSITGEFAFELYDTYGFPLDLTELMARERGLTVDKDGFEKLMEEQRARARAAQKKEVISLSQIETTTPTKFVGYEDLAVQAKVLEVVSLKDKTAVILDASACYAEMGGQVGDTGEISAGGNLWRISNTQKSGNTWLHFIVADVARASGPSASASRRSASGETPDATAETAVLPAGIVTLSVNRARREAIQRHHTVTHLLHWALHEVVSKEASQKGSFVGPDKLTFDFNSPPLTPQQVADVEKLVNERILENAGVSWTEVPHADVKSRKDVMQFFGDKYGDTVRVVQIGGHAAKLDGYSMELCGGTHTRATGEIGLFRIVGESAIAAGVRRIEAVAGLEAYRRANDELHLIKSLAGKVNSPIHELEKKVENLLAHQKELEKSLKSAVQRNAAQTASWLLTRAHEVNGIPLITQDFPDADADYLQAVNDALKSRFKGVIVLGGSMNGAVALVANVSPEFTSKIQAGKIVQQIAPIVGGKGGGKPDNARGGGKDVTKLAEALSKAAELLKS